MKESIITGETDILPFLDMTKEQSRGVKKELHGEDRAINLKDQNI